MSYELGPRTLHYILKDGTQGEIFITIRSQPELAMQVGHGEVLSRRRAEIVATSSWFSRSMTLPGDDDLQAIFRTMTAMDIYLQKICRDSEAKLFGLVVDDIRADLDTFR